MGGRMVVGGEVSQSRESRPMMGSVTLLLLVGSGGSLKSSSHAPLLLVVQVVVVAKHNDFNSSMSLQAPT